MIKWKIELFVENIPDLSRIFIRDQYYFLNKENILPLKLIIIAGKSY